MAPSDILDLFILLCLILANGFFSMAEFAIISSRESKLHELFESGVSRAELVLELLENPGKFLSAIQVGITLIATLAGAFSGVTLSEPLAAYLENFDLISPHSTELALTIVVLGVTYFTLIIGELAPKKIALQHPESIAIGIARLIDLICRISAPVVHLINGSTNLVLKIMGIRQAEKPDVTDEEVMLLLKQGAKKGIFESVEYDMVSRIFRMSDKRASSMMTPKSEIEWIDLSATEEEIISKMQASGRSRFPVAEGSLDNLKGVVRSLDLVNKQLLSPGNLKDAIRNAMKPPLFVPESVPAFQVLELFKENRAHLALVIDEQGSVQGGITLTDVLESIVGDIPADDVEGNRKIVRRSQRTWIIDGLLPVDDFIQEFNLDSFLDEEPPLYDTMGGFLMTKLEKVPSVMDTLSWQGVLFKVIKMNRQRVDKILVIFNNGENGSS
ncbi:HlyC/CorC family transporter [Prosthecochloris sp. N3]|uniref:HlyC/CorC family transporter n=1 Tax=Prosthecochloris ethylica TaxID=2743976 RepID=A0ABR9XP30_9CHLB|nr:hemolysin family protein [Prosthecochloris ethylica]MBF0585814.1 HlyC/CorC family transporter [Prosthecochloris ethylica]MBF0635724.1 HlyC/CorC family transporter [Prosthecochloris ethylica]NUK47022.1 HlyC/CorC family transporter [Prosthecochloris ethylica]